MIDKPGLDNKKNRSLLWTSKLLVVLAGRPFLRSTTSNLLYGLEELKFIRSFQDARTLFRDFVHLLPRNLGSYRLSDQYPPSLQIEPTNYCNVRCICCPTAHSSRKKGFMEYHLYQKIIDQAALLGIKRLRLFLHGEPLLHPDIIAMINYAKMKRFSIQFTSNAFAFSPEKMLAILTSGVTREDHFTFSVLGFSRDVHELVMKRVDHEKVVRNIMRFIELRDQLHKNGPVIETIFYTTPENEYEEAQFYQFWHDRLDHVRLGGRISESFSGYKKAPVVIHRTRTCANIWERMTIYWNGDVTICCEDVDGDWVIGNLKERSIQELWSSEKLIAIKILHLEKRFSEIPFCYDCDM
jgi:radical SAM protein with 4Fe4S-binding SPASM domain